MKIQSCFIQDRSVFEALHSNSSKRNAMTDSLGQEREALWLRVEELTGVQFINHKEPPEILAEYSDEAKAAIEKLKNVHLRINNRADVRRLSKMMKELNNDGEMSAETYLWWVNRY
jgi:hypothetical protein